jgi:transcriptional regulator with XRE-family HTH domain
MPTKSFRELRAGMTPEARKKSEEKAAKMIAAMPLQQLRAARRFTQTSLAEIMGVGQADVSKIENRADVYVSTLAKFIEAMGGRLEIRAVFADGSTVNINQFSSEPEQELTYIGQ